MKLPVKSNAAVLVRTGANAQLPARGLRGLHKSQAGAQLLRVCQIHLSLAAASGQPYPRWLPNSAGCAILARGDKSSSVTVCSPALFWCFQRDVSQLLCNNTVLIIHMRIHTHKDLGVTLSARESGPRLDGRDDQSSSSAQPGIRLISGM